MKRALFLAGFLFFLGVSANAYSTDDSARNYQKKYCKEKTTEQLQKEYKAIVQETDKLVKEGGEACKNAGETFNTMEAERVGRKLYDACESYRYGNIRKQIHKNKVIKKATQFELESRGIKVE